MLQNLEKYKIVLGSNSPRRKALLSGLGIDFEVRTLPDMDETYPSEIKEEEIAEYLAKKKADCYKPNLTENELLITADTIVWNFDEIMGKPADRQEAIAMLQRLSNHVHEVITGVCVMTLQKMISFSISSAVSFGELSIEEIEYYVDKFKPYDKAGAYGIQEWIGYVAVEAINGSFYNVMGLPIQRLYQELKGF